MSDSRFLHACQFMVGGADTKAHGAISAGGRARADIPALQRVRSQQQVFLTQGWPRSMAMWPLADAGANRNPARYVDGVPGHVTVAMAV